MSNGWLFKVCLGVFTLFRVTVIIKALACVQIVISKLSFVFWLKTKQNNDNQKTGLFRTMSDSVSGAGHL